MHILLLLVDFSFFSDQSARFLMPMAVDGVLSEFRSHTQDIFACLIFEKSWTCTS